MATHSPASPVRASLSIFLCASIWGLFWIPLRYFDENGLVALWTVAGINFVGCLAGVIILIFSKERLLPNLKWIVIVGMGMGLSNVFYFAGIIMSDVIRVTFLFYLLPLWATLFSWVLFRVPIGRARLLALLIAVVGIWLLLGAGGWPIPQNLGDAFGLMSGVGWAFGLAMLRGRDDLEPMTTTTAGLFFAFVGAMIVGSILSVVSPQVQPGFPAFEDLSAIALPVIAFGALILWPSLYGQIWGAKFVAATTAALLTMSEIMTATISTSLLDASDLDLISWIGAGLIFTAILVDLFGGKDA